MLRRFLVFLVAFASLSAWAECTRYQITWRGEDGPWSSSKEAACASMNGRSREFGGILVSITVSGAHIDQYGNCAYNEVSLYKTSNEPSVQGTSSGIWSEVVASCDSPCSALGGQDFTLNWSLGYTRTPDIDADLSWKFVAPPLKPPSDGMVCDPVSSCKVALVLSPTAVWQSVSPTSQGLYRVSVDYDAQHMGETCTPTDVDKAGAHPAADKPTCPGFVGEVNGVPGCYGTASNPTANDVPESKPKPPEAGNPPAGKKPDSGEGSGTGGPGRTPSTGDGGPGGGPAGAAGSGNKPDGTTPKPGEGKEQANCGAPGQPKCGIDEGGTPSKFEGDKAALDKWKSDVEANRNTIKDTDGSFFDSYSMFFAVPPIVPCEPIELPNDQVITRQCDVVEGTRSVMSYIWALAAIWICLGWIREAI